MSDIISAKCFGCGHIVKVPGALGGKKARCPKCTNTITIPSPTDTTTDDVVSDAELPEVARDDEVLDGLPVEPEESPEPAERESRPRPGSSTAHRRIPPAGRGAQGGRGAPPRYGAPRKGSSTGLIIGIAVGVLALVVILAVVAGGKKQAPAPKKPADGTEQAGGGGKEVREETEADRELKERVRKYISAFNNFNIAEAARFYGPDAGKDVTQAIGRLAEVETRYKDWNFKSANASTGVVTIICEVSTRAGSEPNREVSWTWKNVDGVWYIDGKP